MNALFSLFTSFSTKVNSDTKWTTLPKLPFDMKRASIPFKINDDQFVIATNSPHLGDNNKEIENCQGIWSFNVNDQCWKLIYTHKYEKNAIMLRSVRLESIGYDNINHYLYLAEYWPPGSNGLVTFMIINILDNKQIMYGEKITDENNNNIHLNRLGSPHMLVIDGCIHCIARIDIRCKAKQHYIFDFNKKDFKVIHTFDQYNHMFECQFIHLKKTNRLMLIGSDQTPAYANNP